MVTGEEGNRGGPLMTTVIPANVDPAMVVATREWLAVWDYRSLPHSGWRKLGGLLGSGLRPLGSGAGGGEAGSGSSGTIK